MTMESAEADMALDVRLLSSPFDPNPEIEAFALAHPEAGGIATFVGKVRNADGVEALELAHYAPLTLPGMEELGRQAMARWPVLGLLIVHRTGLLYPGEPIVAVSAAARHRRDALIVVDFAMDHLKSQSWFWKREKTAGEWRWIEPRAVDFEDLERWAQA